MLLLINYLTIVQNIDIKCLNLQRKEYVKYAKVFPLTAVFDLKIPSKWYRRVVGVLEVVCGLAMATIPNRKYQNRFKLTRVFLRSMWSLPVCVAEK